MVQVYVAWDAVAPSTVKRNSVTAVIERMSLPLLDDLSKLDVMALFEYKANRRHCKEFAGRVLHPEFLVFARFLTADERKTGGGSINGYLLAFP